MAVAVVYSGRPLAPGVIMLAPLFTIRVPMPCPPSITRFADADCHLLSASSLRSLAWMRSVRVVDDNVIVRNDPIGARV